MLQDFRGKITKDEQVLTNLRIILDSFVKSAMISMHYFIYYFLNNITLFFQELHVTLTIFWRQNMHDVR